jgi:hypothetical protein
MKAVIDRHTVNEAWLKTRASRAIVDKVVKSMAATKGVIGIEFGNLDSAGPLILAKFGGRPRAARIWLFRLSSLWPSKPFSAVRQQRRCGSRVYGASQCGHLSPSFACSPSPMS